MTVRVLVVDDQAMVCEGFSVLLDAQPDIEVVGQAVNGQDALDKAAELRPDVVLMDVRMPMLNGLEATRRIAAGQGEASAVDRAGGPDASGGPKVLVVTTFDLDEYVHEALRAGASGFVLKDASAQNLAEAVRVVAARGGDAVALGDPPAAGGVRPGRPASGAGLEPGRAAHRTRGRGADPGRPGTFQRRDRPRPGRRRADGQDPRRRILTKLGLRDRTQAAIFAYETGLVRPGE